MRKTAGLTIHVDSDVPIVKLVRALATQGLVLSNDLKGGLRLHDGPAPVVTSGVGLSVSVSPRGIFRREWWRR